MFYFDYKSIHLECTKKSLIVLLKAAGLYDFVERVKYVTDTNPVKMFKQIGISRGDAFRIMYFDDRLPTMENKELVNYIDFDSWECFSKRPQLKKQYKVEFENRRNFPIYTQLYWARYILWTKQTTTLIHSSNQNMRVDISNRELILFLDNIAPNLTDDLTPQQYVENCANYLDEYILIYYRDKMTVDYNAKTTVPEYITNHCFTNIHVIKSVCSMIYVGNKMKHCASTPFKLKNFENGHLFVQITTNDPRVPEYTVHYKWFLNGIVKIKDYSRKSNCEFPVDFDFSDMSNFRDMLKQRLIDASWDRL